jgi:beta-glucosidase-like glycosyl hydrolase
MGLVSMSLTKIDGLFGFTSGDCEENRKVVNISKLPEDRKQVAIKIYEKAMEDQAFKNRIDESVQRILEYKIKTGLFDYEK